MDCYKVVRIFRTLTKSVMTSGRGSKICERPSVIYFDTKKFVKFFDVRFESLKQKS